MKTYQSNCCRPGRRSVRFGAFGFLVVAGCLATVVNADQQPNIVVLFADDAGYADFGFQPNVRPEMKELTPHIDSIARDGCRFTNAYMSGSVCSPSRAGLMTGRYQQRFGHDNNIPPGYMKGGLPLTETFGAKRMRQLGYRTGLIGKWHLGYPDDFHPNRRGFDFFFGCLQGSRRYFAMDNPTPHRVFLKNDQPTPEAGYITDRIGDGACQFINENSESPFFLFVSFTAPHGPLEAKPEDLERLSHIEQQRRRKYAGLVKSMDDNVGKILKCLTDNGMDESTLVVFTNDNGGQTQTGANNFPLRGRKGQLWEGGVRVPMAIRWPSKIDAGSVCDAPVISLDLLPTFVAAANANVDAAWNLDGVNLLGVLNGDDKSLSERTLYWRQHGSRGAIAARRADWKMLHLRAEKDADPQLFHLAKDIGEATDVSADHPEMVKQLVEAAKEWESELAEPVWGKNSPGFQERQKQGKKKPRKKRRKKSDKD